MYYESKFTKSLGQEFADPQGINDMSDDIGEVIINNMKDICDENEIPARFEMTYIEFSNGLFNKQIYKAIEISHPNPPQSYCKQLYILYPDGIRFFFVGSSKAFSDRNNYEAARNGEGGNFMGRARAMVGIAPDEGPYNLEMEWHNTIYSVFCSLLDETD